jgi:hypothetical protein
MGRPSATPESRKPRYGSAGRPLSDWEVLRDIWSDSSTVRQACGDSFTKFEFHAYAEPRTRETSDGQALTELIWREMTARGIRVSPDPVHFIRTG